MPIDRTAFNALVDDDGTGTLGTVWNKAQIQGVLLDPIDASITRDGGVFKYMSRTDTGVVNNWAPGAGLIGHTYIEWGGTADLTITGLVGTVSGQLVTIKHSGATAAAIIHLAHNDGRSVVASRLYNVASSAPTRIAAFGSATYLFNGFGWVMVAHEQGRFITPPLVAGNFVASPSGTWTISGSSTLGKYRLSGKQLTCQFFVYGSTTSGAPGNLQILAAAYGGYTLVNDFMTFNRPLSDGVGFFVQISNVAYLNLAMLSGGGWVSTLPPITVDVTVEVT